MTRKDQTASFVTHGDSAIPTRIRSYLVFLALALTPRSFANGESDFLIIEQVRSLTIFNQYQQQATQQEKALLLLFVPFKILDANDLLGDGFTPCMKVEVGGKVLYVEKNEDGSLLGVDQSGFQKTCRNATVLGDTIDILKSNRVMLADVQQTHKSFLEKGIRIVRVFSHDGLTYAKLISSVESYGWVKVEEAEKGKDWGFAKLLGVSVSDQLRRVIPQVQLKAKELNAKLSQLFDHFNRKSSQHREPPQWQIQQSSSSILCLLAADVPLDRFSETTRAFCKNIESILLGTDLHIVSEPGRIEIRR